MHTNALTIHSSHVHTDDIGNGTMRRAYSAYARLRLHFVCVCVGAVDGRCVTNIRGSGGGIVTITWSFKNDTQ